MISQNKKIAVICALGFAVPFLLIVGLVGGLFIKSFNDARLDRGLSIWQAVQTWHADSRAEDARLTPQQRERLENNRAAWLAIGPVLVLGIVGYLAPAIIAWRRKHPQAVAITVLNLFAGWSVLGWICALVWAFTNATVESTAAPPIPRMPQRL